MLHSWATHNVLYHAVAFISYYDGIFEHLDIQFVQIGCYYTKANKQKRILQEIFSIQTLCTKRLLALWKDQLFSWSGCGSQNRPLTPSLMQLCYIKIMHIQNVMEYAIKIKVETKLGASKQQKYWFDSRTNYKVSPVGEQRDAIRFITKQTKTRPVFVLFWF